MSDQSYVQSLEQQLADERAYVRVLETTIDLKVEQRVAAEIAKAEQAAYARGMTSNNFTTESFQEYGRVLQAELEAAIPTMLERAIPESFIKMYRPQARCVVTPYEKADTLERVCHVRIVIPEYRIETSQMTTNW